MNDKQKELQKLLAFIKESLRRNKAEINLITILMRDQGSDLCGPLMVQLKSVRQHWLSLQSELMTKLKIEKLLAARQVVEKDLAAAEANLAAHRDFADRVNLRKTQLEPQSSA